MSRSDEIIRIVSDYKKIEVNQLSQLLNVSNVTIRKDLDKLEEKGIINRQHGFALINNTDDINFRLAKNYDLKRKIAVKAAENILDGDTVMIESGSTCALLAEELAFNRKNVTIITNSVFIANYIRKSDSVKVILLGGEYQNNSQVNVGPLIKKVVDEFYVDKLFIGIDGFDPVRGFRSNDLARSEAIHVMAAVAKEVVILTDASKFNQNGTVTCFSFPEISQVFTDKSINAESQKILDLKKIKVTTI